MKAVSALPFVDGAFTHAVTQRQGCSSLRAGRYLRAGCGRSTCVFMQSNHHDKAPGWTAVVTQRLSINWRMTSLAMNSGYRFESMQSSGMRQVTKTDAPAPRSNGAKARGIKMVAARFKISHLDEEPENIALSANFALWGDMRAINPPRCTPAAPAGRRLRAFSHPAR